MLMAGTSGKATGWIVALCFGLGACSTATAQQAAPGAGKPVPKCWKDVPEVRNAKGSGKQPPSLPDRFSGAKVLRTAILVKLCISDTGIVERSIVLSSSGNSDIDRFYDEELSDWVFMAPLVNGKPVKSVSVVAVNWNTR